MGSPQPTKIIYICDSLNIYFLFYGVVSIKRTRKIPLDLLIMFIWTVLTLAFILTPVFSNMLVRTVLGIPMILFITGYVLIAALFPKMDDLGGVERIVLSFGLSIAVDSLLGLLLNFTFGIRLLPLLYTLCVYIIILIIFAVYSRAKIPEEERFYIPLHKIYDIINNEFSISKSLTDRILACILIISIVLSIGTVYFIISVPAVGERYTEFYILNPEGKAANYSANLNYNSPATFMIGVINHENTPINYKVQVALDREVLTETGLRLNNDETWEKSITFIPGKKGTGLKLEFWLFKEDNFTAPYRELHLWVNT